MKLLELEETDGKLFWIQYQKLQTDGGWKVVPTGETVLGYITQKLSFRRAPESWPLISAREKGAIAILKEWGYEPELRINSVFEDRSLYVVKKANPLTVEFTAPLVILGALRGRQKEAVGLSKKLFFHDKFILDMEEDYSGQIVSDAEIQEASISTQDAKIEWSRRIREYFAQKFFENSKDFGLTAVMNIGGKEEFQFEDIPSHFFELGRRCTSFFSDERINLTRTYQVVLINTIRIEEKSAVNIKIPDELRGFVIGEGGAKIKLSAEKLGKKIYVL